MSAILFGSISTIADTSELQRQAFNQAFAAHGLDWNWNQEDYRSMLAQSGGRARIAEYAKNRGEQVDADAVHATKSDIFQTSLASAQIAPRPGVIDTINAAQANGWKLALVTTTSIDNVSALLNALAPEVQRQDFDLIIDASQVQAPKPDKAAYVFALSELDESAEDCVAIEDNADGVRSAGAAGLPCVAFPNENTATNTITGAELRVDHLDPAQLRQLVDAK
jgi:HAD superfamily hydrolase (TIGR01509 family)